MDHSTPPSRPNPVPCSVVPASGTKARTRCKRARTAPPCTKEPPAALTRAVIDGAAAGEPADWTVIVLACTGPMEVSAAWALRRGDPEIPEAVQDAWVVALKRRSALAGRSPRAVIGRLCEMAKNAALNRRSRRRYREARFQFESDRRPDPETFALPVALDEHTAPPTPDRVDVLHARTVVARLDADHQDLFVRRHLDDLSGRALAAEDDVTEDVMRGRLQRLDAALRAAGRKVSSGR